MGLFSMFNSSKPSMAKPQMPRKSQRNIENGSGVEDTGLANREMMAKAERELYQFDAPTQELGLSDLIAKHKPGDRFQYLALTGGDSETYEARMRRMVTFRPKINKQVIPINDLPHIRLINDTENLSLSRIMPKKSEDYLRIHQASGYFAPTVSVMAKFSKVKVALMDSRFSPPAEVQSVVLNSNMDVKIELSMDYCIPKEAVGKLNLVITREQATMSFGEQWGALQMQVMIEFTSFPYMSDMKRVVGILGPTASALEDFDVNPNILDISMTENNRRALREFYQAGDIADEGDPVIIKKKAIKYAKSSIKTLPKGELVESSGVVKEGWEFMSQLRKPQIAAEEASEEPDVSEGGDSDYTPQNVLKAKDDWEKEQERLRAEMDIMSDTTEEITRKDLIKPALKPQHSRFDSMNPNTIDGISIKPAKPKRSGVQFSVGGV